MPRPALDADVTDQSEDFVQFVNQATLTANTPANVLTAKVDLNEQITIETFGTNGGTDITLELKNKNDVIGQSVNGIIAPMAPRDAWYRLGIPMTFVPGDDVKLVATSAAGATTIKFFWKGHAIGQ